MKRSIDAAPEMRFEVYSKLSPLLPDSGFAAKGMRSGRSIRAASKRILISLVVCSVFVSCGLSFVDSRFAFSPLKTEPITSHSNPGQSTTGSSPGPISDPKPSTVKAGRDRSDSRSKLILGQKPKVIYFKGEYYYGKQCTFSPPGIWAMHRTENFKVKEVVRASNELRDRLKNSSVRVPPFDHLRSAPEDLRAGKTYTLRLVPSDRTWTAIEQGDFINVGGDELDFVDSIPE